MPAVADGVLAGVLLAALALLAMASFESILPLGQAAAVIDACGDAAGRIEAVTERPVPVAVPDSPGEAVALVGPSGIGKSTISELMVRFRDPDSGRITFGGTDLRSLDPDRLREAVRLSPQDSYLFTGTLRENIALGKPGADDAEIEEMLETVGLGTWLGQLEEGLLTFVGEGGSRVSGGQRQRIAAARCLLSNARFMVFDEPTAHLDPDGALALESAIVSGRQTGTAVMVITHAIAAPESFDLVLEIDGSGGIAELSGAQAG